MLILRLVRRYRPQVVAAFALALAMCLAPATQAASLYMVSVGVTNAIGHPHLNATAKDARDMAKWAQAQQGKLFTQVHVTTLTDNNATKMNVLNTLSSMKTKAKAGDYVILYDSSHGGKGSNGEYLFCVYDGDVYWNQVVSALRDVPGTKIVILDTCEAGTVTTASSPNGPLIVFASSLSTQSSFDGSSGSGNSLYTQHLLAGLYGKADYNKDGYITLQEAATYASARLKEADKGKKAEDQQNSGWSVPKGVSVNIHLAKLTSGNVGGSGNVSSGTVYTGTETLKGFGKLSFTLQSGGKAVMHDTKSTIHGTWTRSGNHVTLAFTQVGATYHGTLNGTQIAGNATDVKGQSWSFNVHRTN